MTLDTGVTLNARSLSLIVNKMSKTSIKVIALLIGPAISHHLDFPVGVCALWGGRERLDCCINPVSLLSLK